jgi:predicted AlkP superfamily phosphohydrolase/phosphomutase
MLMSDHGFGPLNRYINFNTWLLKEGYIKIKRSFWSQLRHLAFKLGYHYHLAWDVGTKTGIVRMVIRLGRKDQEAAQRKVFLSLDDVDWNRTKVYSYGNYGQMFVNLRGREPQGCVEPGAEYEQVIRQLTAALKSLRDPKSGEQVVDQIWRGAELFQGKYSQLAPDLFFFTKDMKYKAMGLSDFGSNKVFDDLYGTHAHHKMEGIFMLSGPGIRQGQAISMPKLVDLAPTIYHLFGISIPDNLDGKVVTEAFTEELAAHAPTYRDGLLVEQSALADVLPYSSKEEEDLSQILRDLGYVN